MSLKKTIFATLALLSLTWLLAACDAGVNAPTNANTKNYLPDLPNKYEQFEGKNIWDTTSTGVNAILSTALKSQPQYSAIANFIGNFGSCAQQKGVLNWRVYVGKSDPLSSGVVLIVSKNQLTNPLVALECAIQPSRNSAIEPCSKSLNFSRDNDTYYAYLAGTKPDVCTDFENALPK